MSPAWPDSAAELLALQEEIAATAVETWHPPGHPYDIAGLFVCFARPAKTGERAWGAAALTHGSRFLRVAVVEGTVRAPYEPGLLALREGPILHAALRALDARPEVVLVNATGRDHPRRGGLALHLGAVTELPTVGITDRPLIASGADPCPGRFSTSPLRLEGETVGYLLRTRAGARPVAVHAGWASSPEVAVEVVRHATRRARTPEALRRARRAARLARARAGSSGSY